jgi:hypothetical protein
MLLQPRAWVDKPAVTRASGGLEGVEDRLRDIVFDAFGVGFRRLAAHAGAVTGAPAFLARDPPPRLDEAPS